MAFLRRLALDARYLREMTRALSLVRKLQPAAPTSIADFLEKHAAATPDVPPSSRTTAS